MFASAPVFGVGIGRHFDRSAEFMPADLRAIYGNENAHNYFAQQFAELGVVGGTLFLWFVCALLIAGWRSARARPADAMLAGLLAAAGAYLLTSVTGHPLLVPEAAFPFWVAAGALTGVVEHAEQRSSKTLRHVAVAVCALLGAGVVSQLVAREPARHPAGERIPWTGDLVRGRHVPVDDETRGDLRSQRIGIRAAARPRPDPAENASDDD